MVALRYFAILSILLLPCLVSPALLAQSPTITEWKALAGASAVEAVAFSPNGNYFALSHADNTAELYNRDWNLVWSYQGEASNGGCPLAFSPDEKYLAFGRYKSPSDIAILNLADQQVVGLLRGEAQVVESLAFSPDGKHFMASTSPDSMVRIWALEGENFVELRPVRDSVQKSMVDMRVDSLTFAPDSQFLAGAYTEVNAWWQRWNRYKALVWKWVDERYLVTRELESPAAVHSVVFSPDGDMLVVSGEPNTIEVFSESDGRFTQKEQLVGHSGAVTCIAFSPQGDYLASGSQDMMVRLWALNESQSAFTREVIAQASAISCLAFSPDSVHLAVGTQSGETKILKLTGISGKSVVVDTQPPTLKISEPAELTSGKAFVVEAGATMVFSGVVSDDMKVDSVTVNGVAAALKRFEIQGTDDDTVEFSASVPMESGLNTVQIVVTDSSGNEVTETVSVTAKPASVIPDETKTVGERWALLIGVDRYDRNQQGDYYLPNLDAAVKDVKAIDAILRDADRGGFEHVTTLVSNDTPDESDDPTDRNILNALRELVDLTAETDLVVIYFSGHGWQQGSEAYLLPQNFELQFPKRTAIRSADLTEMINQMNARKVVTILDACHSGGITVQPEGGREGGSLVKLNAMYQEAFQTAAGKVVLHSCDADEVSWELRDGSQGVFSKHLVDGLLGAADASGDSNGIITIQEAYRYAHEQVIAHMRKDGRGKQTPVLSGKLIGEIPITVNPQRKQDYEQQKQIDTIYTLIEEPSVAERAIALITKRENQESLTLKETRLLNYLDSLLAGKISPDTYLGADKRFGQASDESK